MMEFLRSLIESNIKYSKDMTDAVPEDLIKEIRKNIRDGASDDKLKWGNALELVHKAYLVANVQKPLPNMKNAWKQYEENLKFAVEELAKHRGMDADWRMSSSMFIEAAKNSKVSVKATRLDETKEFSVVASSMDAVVEEMSELLSEYDVEKEVKEGCVRLVPRRFGIKQPFEILVSG